jgi:hypothetical protein
VVSLILDLLGSLFSPGAEGTGLALDSFLERRRGDKQEAEWAARDKALAAHAQADILILAAVHDGILTDPEREELAASVPKLLAKAGVETTPEELIGRWQQRLDRIASEEDLSSTIRSLGRRLPAETKRELMDVIVRLHDEGGAETPAGTTPYRTGASTMTTPTIELFAQALHIDPHG